jgi:predicted transcriptional regulator
MAMTTKALSFKEDVRVIDKLNQVAKDLGINRSVFVRQAIRDRIRLVCQERGLPDE